MLLLLLSLLVGVAAPAPAAPADAPPILRFVNGTVFEVTALYVSYCGAQDYMNNLLERPGYAAMVPGATVEFRFPPGCYDLHATLDNPEVGDLHQTGISVDDDMLHQWRIDFNSSGGQVAAPPTAGYGSSLGVIEFSNDSQGSSVVGIYLAQCGTDWGGDELDGEPLWPGTTITMNVEPGCWDMYARLEGGGIVNTDGFTVRSGETVRRWINDSHGGR